MTKDKSLSEMTLEKQFNYTFNKLNEAAQKCDSSTLEWIAASTRSNEKALHNRKITENKYMEQQQKITDIIAGFSYNCNCSSRSNVQML